MDPLLALEETLKYNQLSTYLPYGHPDTLCPDGRVWKAKHEAGEWGEWSNNPWQLDFHAAGATNQERMNECANRVGKTHSAAPEVAMHMSGIYPDWWTGRRFTKPVLVWTGSPTNETSRDIVQKALLGGTDNISLGSGWIPRHLIHGKPRPRQAGVPDVVDQFKVKHVSGGYSQCIMKTYEQGWRKWQGTEPDIIWLDEEPDQSAEQKKIFTEALTRLLTSHGIMMISFTPLLGQTDLVMHFEENQGKEGIWLGKATWDDAPHLIKNERDRLMMSYPEWERDARAKGVPLMGEGRIFTCSEDDLIVEDREIPSHWTRIIGIDFGLDHPNGTVNIAIDRDMDCIYVYNCRKKQNEDYIYHASAIKGAGGFTGGIPVSWPHDGVNRASREKKASIELHKMYRNEGVNMLSRSARYKNDTGGAQPQWPVIEEVINREKTGRMKYFKSCSPLLEERRSYHTKDGKIIDRRDDLIKAMLYAVMMKRYAVSQNISQSKTNMPQGFSTKL